jgi:thymidylate synthase
MKTGGTPSARSSSVKKNTNDVFATCSEAWNSLVTRVATSGERYTDQEGRECREELTVLFSIADAGDAERVVEKIRKGVPWLYPSPEELRSVFFSLTSVASGYSYAPRLFGETNQIDGFVIPLLREHPQTRRAVAVPYDPLADSRLLSSEVPSVLSLVFRRVETNVSLIATMRSVDVFLGLPANLYQLRKIQEYVATGVGVPCGTLTLLCVNIHWLPEYSEAARNLGFVISHQP